MKTEKFQLEPLTCPSCIKKIEGTLSKMKGVSEVKVLFDETKITSEELQNTIAKLGYPVISSR